MSGNAAGECVMSEAKRIEELEKGLDQALTVLVSLEARLGSEASQRIAADSDLAQRVSLLEKTQQR